MFSACNGGDVVGGRGGGGGCGGGGGGGGGGCGLGAEDSCSFHYGNPWTKENRWIRVVEVVIVTVVVSDSSSPCRL